MASAQPSAAAAATSTSHPYTCNSCQVAYRNIDLQKTHMKSDWHRYNLKRRVASLPPISADVFTDKVLQARAVSTAEEDKTYFERTCDACHKTYFSENAYQNHLLSQKHKLKQSSAPQPQEDEATSIVSSTFSLGEPIPTPGNEVDSDAEEEFNHVVEGLQRAKISQQRPSPVKRPSNPQVPVSQPGQVGNRAASSSGTQESEATTPAQSVLGTAATLQSCLFCNYVSPTTPLNAHHMERFHGMFIPEKDYLVNLDGLVQQLQRKIFEDHECLYCGKFKSTSFGVQTHMRDTGHCKIPFSTEGEQLEIGEHYDFRSTYSDGEESDSDEEEDEDEDEDQDETEAQQGGAKLGARRAVKTTRSDGGEVANGDGWETDSSASSLDSEELAAVPAEGHIHQFERLDKHPHHSRSDPRARHQLDGWHSHAHKHTHAVFYDEYELHLPSGKSVGHRSLNRYYRQNLNNYPTPEEREEKKAIEDRKRDEEGEEGEEDEADANGNGRRVQALVPRGAAGMVGVSDQRRRGVRRAEQRGRSLENFNIKKNDWAYGKKLNNYKGYFYRYGGGG